MPKNKIEISRSFSQTRQIRQYEPINAFCAAKVEVSEEEMAEWSEKLDVFCKEQVRRSLAEMEPVCEVCGGKQSLFAHPNPITDGMHASCRKNH